MVVVVRCFKLSAIVWLRQIQGTTNYKKPSVAFVTLCNAFATVLKIVSVLFLWKRLETLSEIQLST